MVANTTVLYPAEEDATFDMSYYIKTHMPLVMEKWGSYGLKGYEVVQVGGTADGSKAPFSVLAIMTWGSQEDVKKALGGVEAKDVFGDVPNFSNKGPMLLMGDITGSG